MVLCLNTIEILLIVRESMNPENSDLLEAVLVHKPSCDSDFVFTRGKNKHY